MRSLFVDGGWHVDTWGRDVQSARCDARAWEAYRAAGRLPVLMRTVVQPDADVLVIVRKSLLLPENRALLPETVARHFADLRRQVDRLGGLDVWLSRLRVFAVVPLVASGPGIYSAVVAGSVADVLLPVVLPLLLSGVSFGGRSLVRFWVRRALRRKFGGLF